MSTPVRFPSGVATVGKTNPLGNYGLPDPISFHTFFTDFDTFAAADWTITEIGAGGTQALTDGDGGLLLITTDVLDNDSVQLQKVGESFLMASGKKAFFKARFKMADVIQTDFLIGLAVLDTILLSATDSDGVTDGIFFSKEDGDALLDVACQKDVTTGQSRTAAIATLVADTFVTVAWYYDGVDKLFYYVNDVMLGVLDASSTFLPDTELTPSIAFMNGEAGAETLTIDYVFAAKER
jgi:hypothetical protein